MRLMIFSIGASYSGLQDGNYAKTSGYDADGAMNWHEAMAWVGNLVYGGYSDWRLPTTTLICCGDGYLGNAGIGSGTEMAHMYYEELDWTNVASGYGGSQVDNLQSGEYWSSSSYDGWGPGCPLFYSFAKGGHLDVGSDGD